MSIALPSASGAGAPSFGETVPAYLDVRRDALAAQLTRLPERAEVPVICDEQLVVEHYSR